MPPISSDRTSAVGHYVELYIMASGGCSRLEIQDHIADVRYVPMNVCNVESQFASGYRPVNLTRMVPIAGVRAKAKQPFDFSPEIRKPTLESANNLRRLCGSSGVKSVTGLDFVDDSSGLVADGCRTPPLTFDFSCQASRNDRALEAAIVGY